MRIFMLILSLIAAAACVFLNVLGYNGTLSQVEFILISAAVEILLCLLLGHFMFRTYANRKRAKTQAQELTNTQAALQLAQNEAAQAKEATAAATAARDAAEARAEAAQAKAAQAKADALAQVQKARLDATLSQAPVSAQDTQPLDAASTADDDDLGKTTLYTAPLV